METAITKAERNKFELTVANYQNREAELYHKSRKIREYHAGDNSWKGVRISLDYGATLVGANKPTDEEYLILKKFLAENFKDFSAAEIMLAFSKTAAGQLKNPTEHYGKFSGQYIGKVLNEYKMLRHQKLAEEQRNQQADRGQKEASSEEKKQIRREYIKQCFLKPYNGLKLGERNMFNSLDAVHFFRLFYEKGIIKPAKEELEDYRDKALEHIKLIVLGDPDYRAQRKTKAQLINFEEGGEEPEIERRVKEKAAELYFYDFIKKMIKEKIDIHDFLNFNKFYEV